jgi:hypothetical protein
VVCTETSLDLEEKQVFLVVLNFDDMIFFDACFDDMIRNIHICVNYV